MLSLQFTSNCVLLRPVDFESDEWEARKLVFSGIDLFMCADTEPCYEYDLETHCQYEKCPGEERLEFDAALQRLEGPHSHNRWV